MGSFTFLLCANDIADTLVSLVPESPDGSRSAVPSAPRSVFWHHTVRSLTRPFCVLQFSCFFTKYQVTLIPDAASNFWTFWISTRPLTIHWYWSKWKPLFTFRKYNLKWNYCPSKFMLISLKGADIQLPCR